MQKRLNVRTYAPLFPRIIDRRNNFLLSFLRFATTAGQVLSMAASMCTRYLGDPILIMLDENDDVQDKAVTIYLEEKERDLYNTYKEEHGPGTPSTHTYGTELIGSIWYTKGLKVDAISYHRIGRGIGVHHQLLWVYI